MKCKAYHSRRLLFTECFYYKGTGHVQTVVQFSPKCSTLATLVQPSPNFSHIELTPMSRQQIDMFWHRAAARLKCNQKPCTFSAHQMHCGCSPDMILSSLTPVPSVANWQIILEYHIAFIAAPQDLERSTHQHTHTQCCTNRLRPLAGSGQS